MTSRERFDELLARPVSMRSIGLLRLLLGVITAVHLWPIVLDGWRGDTFHDRFHEPYLAWLASLPAGLYVGALTAALAGAVLTAIGLWSRPATWIAWAGVALHLAMSTTHLHNNRAYLVTVLGLVALAPNDRSFAMDAVRRRRRGGDVDRTAPAWPLWLLRFTCATVYLASGISKLLDPDWFGGTVTWARVTAHRADLDASPLPSAVVDLVLERAVHTVAAKVVVATEIVIGVGLWWRPARRFVIPVAIAFHVMIELSADVQLFSYLAVAVLVVWADPDLALPERRATPRAGAGAISAAA